MTTKYFNVCNRFHSMILVCLCRITDWILTCTLVAVGTLVIRSDSNSHSFSILSTDSKALFKVYCSYYFTSNGNYFADTLECSCMLVCMLHSRNKLEMWANAQRDGRPAEYRWCPLFNAAKFGWRPLLECRAVTLPRRETPWNYLGCPKLMKGSQPLVGRSSPYCEDVWRRYCCLTSFFRLSIRALVAKI